ncbi:DUF2505 domain-containing protein [Haloechinothrix sp. LS1_15]|uniref:DUF2505 domain-containing protein n=1 Tax=Haloechinothrix sp. LS1_15 TaxID=2652248 RepID=UPI00294570F8|nr:DUF2505 domain-containing protein [Haloechinothrix sp. LS1_15]MDV6012609.1 DUF2505 domain-containing protein [Haloechinothrix sp. LS1_15]
MGARIEHTATFDHPIHEVFSALTAEDVLRARLAEVGGDDATLLTHAISGNEVTYRMRQCLRADTVPRTVRELLRGDLEVHREHTWRLPAADDSSVRGSARATVAGVPGEVTAVSELTARGDATGTSCVLRLTGEATVRIPLVGGRFERMIVEHLDTLLDKEDRFTESYLARHAC